MKLETEDIVSSIRDWSLDRIHYLSELSGDCDDCTSVYKEFKEWIDPSEDDLEVISIEF